jgi:hypothetical protein
MNRLAYRARAAIAVAAMSVAALSAAPLVSAWGYSLPFKDTSINGKLTLCNEHGQPVTSGKLDTIPFVWKAVSSAAPPKGYGKKGGKATLLAFQPIQYVDPGNWSGMQMTGSSWYTNADHPVAQSTIADLPLIDMVRAYPPHWDGLLELRMYFTAPGMMQIQSPYPAAVIKVTGDTWTMVSGGGGSCSQGKGLSDETVYLSKAKLQKIKKQVQAGVSAHASHSRGAAGGSSSAHPGTGSPGAGQSSAAHGAGISNGSSGKSLAASTSSAGISTGLAAGIGIAALAFVALVTGTILWWRRRTA